MATQVPGNKVLQVTTGNYVARPTNTIPQTATGTIFNINNGRVFLTSLVGVVTTVMGATATTLSVGVTPTVGSAQPAGLASATAVTSAAVGAPLALSTTVGGALVVGAAGAPVVAGPTTPSFLLSAGALTVTTSASDTGSIQWTLTYVPLDPGASVSAA